nr:hypothetical protein [Tanacetum cinerariifolium]
MAAGGVDLAAADAPAFGGTSCSGRRQAAASGGAEIRFDAQGVDQRAIAHRFFGHLQTQMLGPAFTLLQACMLNVL